MTKQEVWHCIGVTVIAFGIGLCVGAGLMQVDNSINEKRQRQIGKFDVAKDVTAEPLPDPDPPPQPDVDPPAPPRPSPGPEWGIVQKVVFDINQQHDNSSGIIRIDLYDGVSRRWHAYVHTRYANGSITWNGARVEPWELAGNLINFRSQVIYWPSGTFRAGAVKADFSTFP